jgi:hypothetical protein
MNVSKLPDTGFSPSALAAPNLLVDRGKTLNSTIFFIILVWASLFLSACQPIQAQAPAASSQIQPTETVTGMNNSASQVVPQAVLDLEGTYVGSWTLYGLDEASQVVKLATWTDTIKAENAQIDNEQAYVLTTTEMVFDGSNAPPLEFPGKEGYFLMPDGTLGEYFIETFGQISKSTLLGENVWITVTPASAEDLASYRLPNDSSGQHVIVKVITSEEGTEIHRITRVTTVNWRDQAGKDRSVQFVSLEGFHKRQSE